MWFVYIIEGTFGFYYCGMTRNITRRFKQHNCGNSKSTKKNRPYVLKFLYEFPNSMQARFLEKQIKNTGVEKWYSKYVKYGLNKWQE